VPSNSGTAILFLYHAAEKRDRFFLAVDFPRKIVIKQLKDV